MSDNWKLIKALAIVSNVNEVYIDPITPLGIRPDFRGKERIIEKEENANEVTDDPQIKTTERSKEGRRLNHILFGQDDNKKDVTNHTKESEYSVCDNCGLRQRKEKHEVNDSYSRNLIIAGAFASGVFLGASLFGCETVRRAGGTVIASFQAAVWNTVTISGFVAIFNNSEIPI